jgi:hypothetical protein
MGRVPETGMIVPLTDDVKEKPMRFDLEDIQEGAERIVSFELSADKKTVEVMEECDTYFGANLTKEQVGELIKRLQAMHEGMVE